MKKRVCILTNGCLSSAPRVVKEADALAQAGYEVRVVGAQTARWMTEWDDHIAQSKPWKFASWKGYAENPLEMFRLAPYLVAYKAAQKLVKRTGPRDGFAELASSRSYAAIKRLANREPADLYIAHTAPMLPLAAWLAEHHGGRYAFDAEDDHFGSLSREEAESWLGQLILYFDRKFLPFCRYVSAASEGMAQGIANRYGIELPFPLLNVFPLEIRKTLDGKTVDKRGKGVSFYWFSQTTSFGRGLPEAIEAAGRLRGDFEIHFRGDCDAKNEKALRDLARAHNIDDKLFLHAQVPPWELLSRTAEHDVGLALERPEQENFAQTLTNKFFFYLTAGLTVIGTRVPGNQKMVSQSPGIGSLYPAGDTAALAAIMQNLIDNPKTLAEKKQAALEAATTRWNWEKESTLLVGAVRKALEEK